MKLEDIGFYTLSDQRALTASHLKPLHRCELVLTNRCSFKCPYCRGLRKELRDDLPFEEASRIVKIWCYNELKNIRFTGGEPTLYAGLLDLVAQAKSGGCERIALSTNGYSQIEMYDALLDFGVNDFSVSLDSGCCSIGDKLTGGIDGAWDRVVETIKYLSKKTYVSVGMVFTPENVDTCIEDVLFADSLGVADIRVIPSAQYNQVLTKLVELPETIMNKYPILKYRIQNVVNGRHVRGIAKNDFTKCWLSLDDMAVAGGMHFPCIIHLREGGDPIGIVKDNIRKDRLNWMMQHDPHTDPICCKNCLDVCVDYNNKAESRYTDTLV